MYWIWIECIHCNTYLVVWLSVSYILYFLNYSSIYLSSDVAPSEKEHSPAPVKKPEVQKSSSLNSPRPLNRVNESSSNYNVSPHGSRKQSTTSSRLSTTSDNSPQLPPGNHFLLL